MTLGGATELKGRAYGPPGLKEIYGATIKGFTAYNSPAVKIRDLEDGKIQLAAHRPAGSDRLRGPQHEGRERSTKS
ncbi:MAG: hypothetical protein ACR2LI_13110 [Propionibacteriaceae bacterium]